MRKVYKQLRNVMSPGVNSAITKIMFEVLNKPTLLKKDECENYGFPEKESGGMILSADFELAWAPRFSKRVSDPLKHALSKAHQERKNFTMLVKLFEKYQVPVTWATVGHLFLKSNKDFDYSKIRQLSHFETEWTKFTNGDWFDNVPRSDWENAQEWFAPDLIDLIMKSKVKHEIATHTFSHINFSNQICPFEVADDEILYSKKVMKEYGIEPKSICFPFGTYGNVPVLRKHGIKIYRRKILSHQLVYPFYDEDNLLVTLSTAAFDRSNPSWSAKYYQYRFRKAIDKAIRTNTIAHFVFHPSMDPWMISNVMKDVLAYAAGKRDAGSLWIGTMENIASHIESKKSPNPA